MANYHHLFSSNARGLKRSEIRELLKLTRKPGIISFAGGMPAPDLFPVAKLREIIAHVMTRESKVALQYGPTEGDIRLREQIVEMHRQDGSTVSIENVLITTSSQQGLDLVAKILVNPGDIVIMGRPTYVGAIQAFQAYGAQLQGIDLDEEGTRVDLMEREIEYWLRQGKKPKFIYEVPDFQNPSGITMSRSRREMLVSLAEKYDLLIVEDLPSRALRFDGESQPTLMSLLPERIIELHTFSKIFSPGFRLGWMTAAMPVINQAVIAKQAMDLCSSPFLQALLFEYINEGLLPTHIKKLRDAYRKKRDLMLKKLDQYMPQLPGLYWTKPQGGLFLWLTLPPPMNLGEMFIAAVEKKVAYVVGTAFFPDSGGSNCCRLNFTYSTPEEIDTGIHRLADLVREWHGKVPQHFLPTP